MLYIIPAHTPLWQFPLAQSEFKEHLAPTKPAILG